MGDRGDRVSVTVPAQTPPPDRDGFELDDNRVSPRYFSTLKLPLLEGREFTERDRDGVPPVAIVNRAMARRFWPNDEALGQRIKLRGETAEREIVGIAQNAKFASVGADPEPYVYLPSLQRYRPLLTLHVRTPAPPAPALEAIKAIVQDLDRDISAYDGRPMRERMAFSLVPVDIAKNVLAVSGVIALVLALGGLYGLVTYTVAQRFREIGIRIALGASRSHVFAVILGGALRLTAIGIALGVAGAAASTRVLRTLLYGLSPTDPLTFAMVAGLMAAVAGAAAYGAARRGMQVDPMVALRHE
jgi:predicted permease